MMRSATAFLPPSMMTFMNLESSTFPYFGSGRISRLGTSRRRGMVSPLICFSWHSFEHRESHHGFHLLDPHPRSDASGHFVLRRLPDDQNTVCALEPRGAFGHDF